jgi:hypothetical protein
LTNLPSIKGSPEGFDNAAAWRHGGMPEGLLDADQMTGMNQWHFFPVIQKSKAQLKGGA